MFTAAFKIGLLPSLILVLGGSSLGQAGTSLCPLELSSLSQFQETDTKIVKLEPLFNFLTKENNILFSPLHFTALEGAVKYNGNADINIKKFKKLYSYSTSDQQFQFAEIIWKTMLLEMDPYKHHNYGPNSPMPPEAHMANDLFDLNKLTMYNIESLNKLAEYWRYSYPEYLKTFQVILSIEKNLEIRKQTIILLATSLTESIPIAQKVIKDRASWANWKFGRGGLTYSGEHILGPINAVTSGVGGMGIVMASIVAVASGLHDPIAPYVMAGGAGLAALPTVTYNALAVPGLIYRKSTSAIQIALLKRKVKKQIAQLQAGQELQETE